MMHSSLAVTGPTLSVVIPNARSFPVALVEQLQIQCMEGDEIIVVRNQPKSGARHWVGISPDIPTWSRVSSSRLQVSSRIPLTVTSTLQGFPLIALHSRAGAAAARNHGWQRAKNEFVLFLDDDVMVGSDFLCDIRASLTSRNALGVMTFRVRSSSAGPWADLARSTICLDRGSDLRMTEGAALSLNDIWMFGAGAAILVARSVLTATGGFKEPLGAGLKNGGTEDAEFLWHASHHTAVAYNGRIAIAHDDVSTFEELAKKLRQYGRAIGHLGGLARSVDGYRYVAGYCSHLLNAVSSSDDLRGFSSRQFACARRAVIIAVAESLRIYASSTLGGRSGAVLCAKCWNIKV